MDAGSLGALYVVLAANSAQLVTGMSQAVNTVKQSSTQMTQSLNSVTSAAKTLGAAFVVREIEGFVSDTLKGINALQKFSEETGITIQWLAELRYVADRQNAGEVMEMALRRFARASEEAQVEGSKMSLLFKQLGVNPFGPLDQGFEKVMGDLRGFEDGAAKTRLAMELFNVHNSKFLRISEDINGTLAEQREHFRQLSGFDMKQAGEMAEKWTQSQVDLKTATKGLALTFSQEFLPYLTSINNQMATHNESFREGAKILGDLFGGAIKLVVKIYEGWLGLLQTVAMFALQAAQGLTKAISGSLDTILYYVTGVATAIEDITNLAVKAINKMLSMLPKGMGGGAQLGEVHFDLTTNSNEIKAKLDEWAKLMGEASKQINMDLQKEFNTTTKVIVDNGKKTAEAMQKGAAPIVDEIGRMAEEIKRYLSPDGFIKAFTQVNRETARVAGIPGMSDFTRIEDDKLNNARQLEVLRQLGDAKYKLTDEQEAKRQTLLKKYKEQEMQLTLAQNKLILGTLSKMSDDMLTIGAAWAGKQSGVYKAMFAASKAFAVAESTVKIMQGVASAASQPWPLNLAAMASVVAATANIVSTIQAVKLEFGGQKALGGPVESGRSFLVGENGPEVFSPSSDGNIIPNNRIGGNVSVQVHNYTDATPVITERKEGDERVIEVMMKRMKNDFASDIRDGKGPLSKSLERTFGLRRGQTQT